MCLTNKNNNADWVGDVSVHVVAGYNGDKIEISSVGIAAPAPGGCRKMWHNCMLALYMHGWIRGIKHAPTWQLA